jgi:hypothetical protein
MNLKFASQVARGDVIRFPNNRYYKVTAVMSGLDHTNRAFASSYGIMCVDRDTKIRLRNSK